MMNKKMLVVAMTTAVLLSGCGKSEEESREVALDTQKQRISYVFGLNVGQNAKDSGLELDRDAFLLAIDDILETGEPRMSEEDIGATMQAYQEEQMEKRRVAQKEAEERNRAEGEAFLAENAEAEGVVVTDSGLQYRVIEKGEGGPTPGARDTVTVHYRGTLIDGTEFDSSHSRGQPATFPLSGVIAGWTEGLQLMSPGDKYEFFISPELGYGSGGHGPIPPAATLIFEVELLEIEAVED